MESKIGQLRKTINKLNPLLSEHVNDRQQFLDSNHPEQLQLTEKVKRLNAAIENIGQVESDDDIMSLFDQRLTLNVG